MVPVAPSLGTFHLTPSQDFIVLTWIWGGRGSRYQGQNPKSMDLIHRQGWAKRKTDGGQHVPTLLRTALSTAGYGRKTRIMMVIIVMIMVMVMVIMMMMMMVVMEVLVVMVNTELRN